MLRAERQQLKVRRSSTRKRARDGLRSSLTPARKKGTGTEKGLSNRSMADENPTEVS